MLFFLFTSCIDDKMFLIGVGLYWFDEWGAYKSSFANLELNWLLFCIIVDDELLEGFWDWNGWEEECVRREYPSGWIIGWIVFAGNIA